MNSKTGAVAVFETEDDAIEAGYDMRLTTEQAKGLKVMNRHDRRAWAAGVIRSAAINAGLPAEKVI